MRRRLLLVEDDPSLRRALAFNLTREGYEVTSAADGEAALEAARNERLGLVLLDVMLPGMSGVEVLRVLRREGVTTPVIILSAKGDEIDRVVGLKVGADDYVAKPFSRPQLLARIWGYDYLGDGRTVDVHVSWLRGKLRGPDGHNHFRTVRGVGYAFAPPP